MRGKYFFRYMLLISLIVAATMGCKLIENIRGTVQLASTGVAVATDIGGLITQLPRGCGRDSVSCNAHHAIGDHPGDADYSISDDGNRANTRGYYNTSLYLSE